MNFKSLSQIGGMNEWQAMTFLSLYPLNWSKGMEVKYFNEQCNY